MNSETTYNALQDKLLSSFEQNKELILSKSTSGIADIRAKAYNLFKEIGFPDRKQEDWRNTDISKAISLEYKQIFEPSLLQTSLDKLFKCRIHDFDTDQISLLNGWYLDEEAKIKELPNGVIIGSLAEAFTRYPDIINKHFSKYANYDKDGFTALNTAFAQDGFFLYIPDGTILEKPIQMVSIINWSESLMVQTRNLIILGKNAKLTLVHCDDSTNQQAIFKNSINEVYLDENATLDHYKLQNLNNNSSLINSTFFHQEANSNLTTNAITLNGGLIRNYTNVKLNGEGANADIFGVSLMDGKQHISNQVYVDHAKPNCYSNELFKGIIDEQASSVFNGHVLVRKDAQNTNAFQNNKNILLTDDAKANSKPFLEIYADDVKCSHGATVGQLDNDAMFYLRSRGICEANARLLLMYAFAGEVIEKISIQPLRERIDEMVKQRLKGELHICETCALHCEGPKKEIIFEIDMSKV
jgi:Fe-S cluster assembly protein SufD